VKRMAEDLIEGISGVKDVHNHLRTSLQGSEMVMGPQSRR
jgi:hypothetical protein